MTKTPTATCTAGHTHVSWFAAQACGTAPLPATYGPLTATERQTLSGLPTSR